MAARLTVIVSQSAIREGRLVDLEETLVTELMLAAGMDATLVGPLELIRPDSTDYLCLTGFQHSLAFVSWLDEQQVREHWARLGLSGVVRRAGAVGDEGTASGRVIYYFPLTMANGTEAVLQEMRDLQRDRSVKTVAVALPKVKALPTTTRVASETSLGSSIPNVQASLPVVLPVINGQKQILPIAPNIAVSRDGDNASDDEEAWENLDQLVDDFDALDL